MTFLLGKEPIIGMKVVFGMNQVEKLNTCTCKELKLLSEGYKEYKRNWGGGEGRRGSVLKKHFTEAILHV